LRQGEERRKGGGAWGVSTQTNKGTWGRKQNPIGDPSRVYPEKQVRITIFRWTPLHASQGEECRTLMPATDGEGKVGGIHVGCEKDSKKEHFKKRSKQPELPSRRLETGFTRKNTGEWQVNETEPGKCGGFRGG